MTWPRILRVLRLVAALAVPAAAYYVLRWLGFGVYATILIVAAGSALPALVSLIRRRPVGQIGLYYSLMSAGALLVALVPGTTELLLAKGAVLTAATGAWFLATLRSSRPLTYVLTKPLIEGRLGWPGGWEQWWEESSRFRRMWSVSTLMWAAGLFIDAGARVVMAYTLPPDDVPGLATVLYVVTLVVLNIVTNVFYVFYPARERRDRLVTARSDGQHMAAETGLKSSVPVKRHSQSADPRPRVESKRKEHDMKKILMVLTSVSTIGDTDEPTGYNVAEAAHPWKVFKDSGHFVDFASIKGGQPPRDEVDQNDPIQVAFTQDEATRAGLYNTARVDVVDSDQYDAVYLVGGHGTMWDFPDSDGLQRLVADVYAAGGVVGAVCHGPAGLINVTMENGIHLVNGKKVSAFTNDEEVAAGKDKAIPFFLADRLEEQGATHVSAGVFEEMVVVDDRLVTGQNPASAGGVAKEMEKLLAEVIHHEKAEEQHQAEELRAHKDKEKAAAAAAAAKSHPGH